MRINNIPYTISIPRWNKQYLVTVVVVTINFCQRNNIHIDRNVQVIRLTSSNSIIDYSLKADTRERERENDEVSSSWYYDTRMFERKRSLMKIEFSSSSSLSIYVSNNYVRLALRRVAQCVDNDNIII